MSAVSVRNLILLKIVFDASGNAHKPSLPFTSEPLLIEIRSGRRFSQSDLTCRWTEDGSAPQKSCRKPAGLANENGTPGAITPPAKLSPIQAGRDPRQK
jgi:hypothetical protein